MRTSLLPLLAALTTPALADTFSVQVATPPAVGLVKHMGAQSPTQGDIGWDAASLVRDGKPWLPVMGEFHYARYPNAEWRDELLKMKAGGVTLISTYVFWIYHEEVQGQFTWDGDKDLHKFIQTCKDVGLPVIVRIGPWCHGEVRNGGFPDWVQALPRKRTNDPDYLAAVRPYYAQIAAQMKGLYWKDGGPIIGIQFENEFKGPAAHLVTLKQIGQDDGIDVPLYTRTAWDQATNVPTFGQVLPLWGGYAEGFWDRSLDTMPGNYWQVFQFARDRSPNNAMGSDPTHPVPPDANGDVQAYPYLTCELGGGMMSSYHRRIDISPMDVYATALTKIGSGSNMPGYYMYHGGTNPEGKLTYLMESQSPPQNMWNDMPVRNYDFGAILGACGEVRDSYHLTRMLHLFLNDWGSDLARMPAYIAGTARNKTDANTLRWSVRSDGKSGFLFVNNYQRAQEMPAKPNTQFDIKLPADEIKVPGDGGITIPANTSFIWPLNMDLGGATLISATAQPLCRLVDGDTTYTFFAPTPGVPADFFLAKGVSIDSPGNTRTQDDRGTWVHDLKSPRVLMTHSADGRKQVLLLVTPQPPVLGQIGYMPASYQPQSVWKAAVAGKDHVFFSGQNLAFDGDKLVMQTNSACALDVVPPLASPTPDAGALTSDIKDGVQHLQWQPASAPAPTRELHAESIKPAGPLRTITMGSQKVAAEPTDADFDNAAVWHVNLPAELKGSGRHVILRLHYTGDVARIYFGDGAGKPLLDDFYHGQPLDLGTWRYGDAIFDQGLTIKILPLQKNAPIYMAQWPQFDGPSIAQIDSIQLVEDHPLTLTAK